VRWAALLSAPVAGFIHDLAGATAQLRDACWSSTRRARRHRRASRSDVPGAEWATEGVLLVVLAVRLNSV
jgi:hypothetical protein